MTMTTSDIITELSESDDALDMLEYIIVKHWGDNYEERIYIEGFDSFVDYIFDLDIHGWELVEFNKSKYPRSHELYSIYIGSVNVEFSHGEYQQS